MKLEILDVCKSFGKVKALDHLSLTLQPGVYGILGPNGAGKSTLINLLTDNLKRDSGEILLDGKEILTMGKQYRMLVGYMPQQQICYEGFSAQHYLEYMAVLQGLSLKDKSAKNQIAELLHKVNLYEERNRKIGGFSGGMKRRVLLAQALLGDPKILILDEPTAGLDPKERISLRNMIAGLAKDRIVVLATHIVSDIECISDHIILIKNGSVICCKAPGELIDSIEGKVAEVFCDGAGLPELQKRYPVSNVYQTRDGYVLHIVGDKIPKGTSENVSNVNLEDVYLYYFEGKC